ncbi:MAG: hypothetical protein K8L91_17300 [Anaerolineae bacterium]|nr:hypothetical protein [Anaerolineae bacterium]
MRYLLILLTLLAMLFVAGCGEPKIQVEVSHGEEAEGEHAEGEAVEGEGTTGEETHTEEGAATEGETTTSEEPAAPSIAESLAAAGVEVEEGEAIAEPLFEVEGHILTVNGQEVQVYEFADAAAAEEQAALVAPDGTSIGTTPVSVETTPHFYHKDHTIAFYAGEDAAVLAALEVVFGVPFAGGTAE